MENDKTCPEHVTVDLTGVGGWEDFWGRIQTAFVFSDGFGKNWDAFWDVLSKECPASKVTVVGANRLPAAWKNSAGVPFPEMIRRISEIRNSGKNSTSRSTTNLSMHKMLAAMAAVYRRIFFALR